MKKSDILVGYTFAMLSGAHPAIAADSEPFCDGLSSVGFSDALPEMRAAKIAGSGKLFFISLQDEGCRSKPTQELRCRQPNQPFLV